MFSISIRSIRIRTMFLRNFNRFVHTGNYLWAAEKNSLATLRKKTGYTFANCKKALELHQNDIVKAEEWLNMQAQELGWSKATKLEGRATKQGLIGVLIKNNIGAMVEVNCETDFVARNENFQKFVNTVSSACTNYVQSANITDLVKIHLTNEELKDLPAENGKSLAENLALVIGNVGENASLRRAICFKSIAPIQLFGYAHPHAAVQVPQGVTLFGKYGSIVALKALERDPELTKNLCQHIVGMNPAKIGNKDKDQPNENKDDETCLIYQEFLLNPDVTVGEVLTENHVEIIDFQRFECGENLEDSFSKQPEGQKLKKAAN